MVSLTARPTAAAAQEATIVATATVVARPLMLLGIERGPGPSMLRVSLDGCGSGTVAVDAHSPMGRPVRMAQLVVPASVRCDRRDMLVTLTAADASSGQWWEVTLVQGDGLLAPAVSQFVISAAAVRASRDSLLH